MVCWVTANMRGKFTGSDAKTSPVSGSTPVSRTGHGDVVSSRWPRHARRLGPASDPVLLSSDLPNPGPSGQAQPQIGGDARAWWAVVPAPSAVYDWAPVMLIIQLMPNLSMHMPKVSPQGAVSSGSAMVPPPERAPQ